MCLKETCFHTLSGIYLNLKSIYVHKSCTPTITGANTYNYLHVTFSDAKSFPREEVREKGFRLEPSDFFKKSVFPTLRKIVFSKHAEKGF